MAYRNTFIEQRTGAERRDVLLAIAETKAISEWRQSVLGQHPKVSQFAMRAPHITYKTYYTQQQAERCVDAINGLLHAPYQVTITGVTID